MNLMYIYYFVYFILWFCFGILLWYLFVYKEGKEILSFSGFDELYYLFCDGKYVGLVIFILYFVLSGFFGDFKLEVLLFCVGLFLGKVFNLDISFFVVCFFWGLLDWKKDKKIL